MFWETAPFNLSCQIYVWSCLQYSIITLLMLAGSVVISLISLLTVFWVFSIFSFSPMRFVNFIDFKESAFSFKIFYWFLFFYLIHFCIVLELTLLFSLVSWGRSLDWFLSSSLMYVFSVINFPFSTVLATSHKFWYIFIFIQINIFLKISLKTLIHGLFRSVLLASKYLEIFLSSFCCWFLVESTVARHILYDYNSFKITEVWFMA